MFVTYVLASALLFGSVLGQRCSTSWGIQHTSYLIENLKDDPSSKCSCSANVTSCLCLPIPSDDCTTPCFQEGMSQVTNATQQSKFSPFFFRVKRIVETLKSNKCQFFSCEKPCNQTTAGNTVSFLKSLLKTFQKTEVQVQRSRA
ncbi:interleukin 9 [Rattus norvegicus]|uniref:Interleukin 9 n=2 Tax=Rattus norvegicus TaxID=10116 RepID=A6KAN0_RAT|nr:interleukin-9 precursor [Rattus norvegicus]EDL93938.1 interleukin 9 [Rattus norvegicus]|eukprot:NP_001099217.1 interleukin-9 precursor [Rattus norvegicus]